MQLPATVRFFWDCFLFRSLISGFKMTPVNPAYPVPLSTGDGR